jgi:hypothetical protein
MTARFPDWLCPISELSASQSSLDAITQQNQPGLYPAALFFYCTRQDGCGAVHVQSYSQRRIWRIVRSSAWKACRSICQQNVIFLEVPERGARRVWYVKPKAFRRLCGTLHTGSDYSRWQSVRKTKGRRRHFKTLKELIEEYGRKLGSIIKRKGGVEGGGGSVIAYKGCLRRLQDRG